MSLFLTLELPPSDNKLYWVNQWGKLTLTTMGKNYKRMVSDKIARLVASSFSEGRDFRPNIPYELFIAIYFPKVEAEGWPKTVKNRYVRLDTGNRQKLVIDSIMEAVGIDDRHIFKEFLEKRVDPENPRIETLLRERDSTC